MSEWLRITEIAVKFDVAVAHIKTFIERGNISINDLQFRPLRVYMTSENIQKFSDFAKIEHKKTPKNSIYIHNWNYTAYNCYKSNYDCDNCIVSKLETITKCNMPAVVQVLLNTVGEPKNDLFGY